MYTYEDMVAALQNGKTVEDITAQMAKELSAAKAEADRLAAERQAAVELKNKRERVAELLSLLAQYVHEFYPNSAIAQIFTEHNAFPQETVDAIMQEIDELVKAFEPVKKIVTQQPNDGMTKDPLEAFLDMFVR